VNVCVGLLTDVISAFDIGRCAVYGRDYIDRAYIISGVWYGIVGFNVPLDTL